MPNRQREPKDGGVTAPSARLRVAPRSVAAAVATVGLTLAGLRVLASAHRVIVWVLIAASIATLLSPTIQLLARSIPRGVAVAAVMLASIGVVAGATYGLVGDVVAQTRTLEEQAPKLAARLEREGRFADAAREARLSERVRAWVTEIPARLRGGTPAEAFRAAATRGLAFLAVTVLTVFFLLHGPNLVRAAGRQIRAEERRRAATRIAAAVYRRSFGYARGTLVMALLAGGVAYALARLGGVPGPAPLAVWVALWDAVPLLGALIGALPIVVFAAVLDPTKGVVIALAFVAYQSVEYLLLQRRLEARTARLGPFLTTAAGFAGVELYGLAGALLAMLAVCIAVVVLDEWAAPA
jgi:predicted PurR-regulated permease PerM